MNPCVRRTCTIPRRSPRAHFVLHPIPVILRRLLGEAEVIRDFLVGQPFGDQGNPTLSFTTHGVLFSAQSRLVPPSLHASLWDSSPFCPLPSTVFAHLSSLLLTSFLPFLVLPYYYFLRTSYFLRVRLCYSLGCRPRHTLFSERMPFLWGEIVHSWPTRRT
jgi:hypothetical protein